MITKCCYCGKQIGLCPGATRVSHGVCGHCLPQALEDCGLTIQEYIDKLDQPALLVDAKGRPALANVAFKREFASITRNSMKILKKHSVQSEETVEMIVKRALETGMDVKNARTCLDLRKGEKPLDLLVGVQLVGEAEAIVRMEQILNE